MKNLMKAALVLIILLSSALSWALSPSDIINSKLSAAQKIAIADALLAAKTDTDSTAVQANFDTMIQKAKDEAAAAELQEMRKQLQTTAQTELQVKLVKWVQPDSMTITKVLTDLPTFFTDNNVNIDGQNFCIDFLGKRYASLKLNTLDNSKPPAERVAAMLSSYQSYRQIDARIATHIAGLPKPKYYDGQIKVLLDMFAQLNNDLNQRMDDMDARMDGFEKVQLNANQLTAALLDRIHDRVKLKGDNQDDVRQDITNAAAKLHELGTIADKNN